MQAKINKMRENLRIKIKSENALRSFIRALKSSHHK